MSGRLFGTGISPPTALKAIGKTLEHSARHYLPKGPSTSRRILSPCKAGKPWTSGKPGAASGAINRRTISDRHALQ